jgi:hypothetical protein
MMHPRAFVLVLSLLPLWLALAAAAAGCAFGPDPAAIPPGSGWYCDAPSAARGGEPCVRAAAECLHPAACVARPVAYCLTTERQEGDAAGVRAVCDAARATCESLRDGYARGGFATSGCAEVP